MINVEAHSAHCPMVNATMLWWTHYLVKGTIQLCLKKLISGATFVRQSWCTTRRLGIKPYIYFFRAAHPQAAAARIPYVIFVYGIRRTAATQGKTINTSHSSTRARAISSRIRSVVNGFRLIGGPFFAGAHDTGTLLVWSLFS